MYAGGDSQMNGDMPHDGGHGGGGHAIGEELQKTGRYEIIINVNTNPGKCLHFNKDIFDFGYSCYIAVPRVLALVCVMIDLVGSYDDIIMCFDLTASPYTTKSM